MTTPPDNAPNRPTDGKVPIFESAGQGVRFLIENWRFALMVGVIGAGAQILLVLLLGATPLAFPVVTIVSAAIYAALLGAALYGPANVPPRVARDAARLWLAMAVVGFFLIVISVVILFFGMGVLIGPYAEEVKAAGEDSARLMEIFQRAATERQGVALGLGALCVGVWYALTSRFYLAGPATIDEGRVRVFETWRWTQGNMLRIIAARIVLLVPACALWFAAHGLIAWALGLGVASPLDTAGAAALAQANPLGFMVLTLVSQVAQIVLLITLEAGLCAYLYRGLKPAAPAPS